MRGEPSTDGNSRVQPRALFLLLSQCEPLWFKNQYKEEALEITALVPVTISIESTLRFRKESGNNERSWQFSIFSRWRIEDGKNSTRRANKNLEHPIIIYHDFNSTSRKGVEKCIDRSRKKSRETRRRIGSKRLRFVLKRMANRRWRGRSEYLEGGNVSWMVFLWGGEGMGSEIGPDIN